MTNNDISFVKCNTIINHINLRLKSFDVCESLQKKNTNRNYYKQKLKTMISDSIEYFLAVSNVLTKGILMLYIGYFVLVGITLTM